jgi:predicted RND superfamily exporter protein
MKNAKNNLDRIAVNIAIQTIRWRWWVIFGSLLAVIAAGTGGQFLTISSNYRAFLSDVNPELVAFENFQATYTKNDNFLFVVQPPTGDAFAPEVAEAVETLTELAWSIPFTLRVDSISNFQHTWSSEDDLVVEDLIIDGQDLSKTELESKRAVALAEPLLKNQLISTDVDTTGINVVLQYPELDFSEVPMAAVKAREVRAQVQQQFPDLHIAISGISMLNNGFAEFGMKDMSTLVPLMYATLLLMMLLTLRSVSATFAALLVIAFSTVVAMGVGGFFRIGLTPVSMTAPTIILTLAIADSG